MRRQKQRREPGSQRRSRRTQLKRKTTQNAQGNDVYAAVTGAFRKHKKDI